MSVPFSNVCSALLPPAAATERSYACRDKGGWWWRLARQWAIASERLVGGKIQPLRNLWGQNSTLKKAVSEQRRGKSASVLYDPANSTTYLIYESTYTYIPRQPGWAGLLLEWIFCFRSGIFFAISSNPFLHWFPTWLGQNIGILQTAVGDMRNPNSKEEWRVRVLTHYSVHLDCHSLVAKDAWWRSQV